MSPKANFDPKSPFSHQEGVNSSQLIPHNILKTNTVFKTCCNKIRFAQSSIADKYKIL